MMQDRFMNVRNQNLRNESKEDCEILGGKGKEERLVEVGKRILFVHLNQTTTDSPWKISG